MSLCTKTVPAPPPWASATRLASAHLFHIVSNHPFGDADKRSGLLAALTFLGVNGVKALGHSEALHDLALTVSEGSIATPVVAAELERLVKLSA